MFRRRAHSVAVLFRRAFLVPRPTPDLLGEHVGRSCSSAPLCASPDSRARRSLPGEETSEHRRRIRFKSQHSYRLLVGVASVARPYSVTLRGSTADRAVGVHNLFLERLVRGSEYLSKKMKTFGNLRAIRWSPPSPRYTHTKQWFRKTKI